MVTISTSLFGEGQVSQRYVDVRYIAAELGDVCDQKVAVGLGSRMSHWLGVVEVTGIIIIKTNYRGNIYVYIYIYSS